MITPASDEDIDVVMRAVLASGPEAIGAHARQLIELRALRKVADAAAEIIDAARKKGYLAQAASYDALESAIRDAGRLP